MVPLSHPDLPVCLFVVPVVLGLEMCSFVLGHMLLAPTAWLLLIPKGNYSFELTCTSYRCFSMDAKLFISSCERTKKE
jgi:hypothetical protein